MIIETNKSGIEETFAFINYKKLGKSKKALKLATIRHLPEIIANGELYDDNVVDEHKNAPNKKFAYIQAEIVIDGKDVLVKIDVKKSPQKNKFWVHRVDIKEKVNDSPTITNKVMRQGDNVADYGQSITEIKAKVNENNEKTDDENEKNVKSIKLSPDAKKVLEENPELKQVFEYLQKQFKLARKTVPSEEQLMSYAEEFKKNIPTTIDVYELKREFRNIYSILASMTDSRGLEYATSATFKLAEKILNNSKILDEENLKKKELREQLNSALKGRKFRLTEEVKQEIIYHYGSWQEFVKQSHGISMHLAKNAKHTLESEWSDLCSELPDLLDSDTNEKDQVFALIEAYNETEVDYGLHDDYEFNSQVQ